MGQIIETKVIELGQGFMSPDRRLLERLRQDNTRAPMSLELTAEPMSEITQTRPRKITLINKYYNFFINY